MRHEPTWRIPFGVLLMVIGLAAYGLAIARYVPGLIGQWPALAQTPVYVVLGIAWIVPLGRFLAWMETGRWRRQPKREKGA